VTTAELASSYRTLVKGGTWPEPVAASKHIPDFA